MFSVRLPPELIKRIDDYAKQNEESRSRAMRELLEAGLAYKAAAATGRLKPRRNESSAPKRRKEK
jgi:metal-responsive CopG/Arc/MetJ family transcriptional regulator